MYTLKIQFLPLPLLCLCRYHIAILHACTCNIGTVQLSEFKVQATQVPLEKSVINSCHLKFLSVLSDLSGLALKLDQPATTGDEAGGRSHVGGAGRFGAPGVMKDGRFFVSELFGFARDVMSESGDSVSPLEPFSDGVSYYWMKLDMIMDLVLVHVHVNN